MDNEKQHYPLAKVKALRAYFDATKRSAKRRPEYADLETTVKLCEQLIALMEPGKAPAANAAEAISRAG